MLLRQVCYSVGPALPLRRAVPDLVPWFVVARERKSDSKIASSSVA